MKKTVICLAAVFLALSLTACSGDEEVVIESQNPEEEAASTDDHSEEAVPSGAYVYVTGAVKNPGIYEVPSDTRIFQVIDKAGGFTEDADAEALNLASQVQDGSVIRVPDISRETGNEAANEDAYETVSDSGLININTASLTDLTHINGIGESRAQAIISYREENGPFGTIEDIKKVSGIKDGLFNKIKDQITV
ncbi:MAG: ComEA family DNA-binding protein [Lachnospiraceae bacterium]|nr:ComEA family DNA-binding protein [Lachnospiraceae bacterium]